MLLWIPFPVRYSPSVRPPVPRDHVLWIINGQEVHPVSSKDPEQALLIVHILAFNGSSCMPWFQLCHFLSLVLAFLVYNVRELDKGTSELTSSFDIL